MLDSLSIDDFRALVGSPVRVSQGASEGALEVADVRPLHNPTPRSVPPFVVTLRHAGTQRSLSQGMYRLHHPRHGALDLFMVPVGPDGRGMCYEVVFN